MKKIHKDDYFELAIFCAHYHSGQCSRGYRLLCKLDPNFSSSAEQQATQTEIYQYLVQKYGDTV